MKRESRLKPPTPGVVSHRTAPPGPDKILPTKNLEEVGNALPVPRLLLWSNQRYNCSGERRVLTAKCRPVCCLSRCLTTLHR